MNFFGRNKTYFRGAMSPTQRLVPISPELQALEQRYIRFVENEFVTADMAAADFRKICSLRGVRCIAIEAIEDVLCLVVDLGRVILTDLETEYQYDIGDMCVTLRRHPDAEVQFYNQTRPIFNGDTVYHHPHVWGEGIICSRNTEPLLQALAAGNVVRALKLAIEAAYSYGPGNPVCPIEAWPRLALKERENA